MFNTSLLYVFNYGIFRKILFSQLLEILLLRNYIKIIIIIFLIKNGVDILMSLIKYRGFEF